MGFRSMSGGNDLTLASSTSHGEGNFSNFLGSVHWPVPARYNRSFFARNMHSTSEFAKIVLSKCVKHLNRCKACTLFVAGGPWALGWHGPTKTHPSCCANVPAIFESWWDVANPRTTMPFFNENHIRLFELSTWTDEGNFLFYLSAQLAQSETAVNLLSITIFCLYCGILPGLLILFYSSRWRRRNFPFTPHQTLLSGVTEVFLHDRCIHIEIR